MWDGELAGALSRTMTLWRDEGEKRVGKHLWLCGVCADGMAGAVGSGEFCFWTLVGVRTTSRVERTNGVTKGKRSLQNDIHSAHSSFTSTFTFLSLSSFTPRNTFVVSLFTPPSRSCRRRPL